MDKSFMLIWLHAAADSAHEVIGGLAGKDKANYRTTVAEAIRIVREWGGAWRYAKKVGSIERKIA
jgi:hypothetical protein